MQELAGWGAMVVCAAGLAGCGFPKPADVVDDGGAIDTLPPPGPQFLSCAELAATCGAGGNHNCCDSPEVLGGTYDRSYDAAGDANSGTTGYPATITTFRLDKYEVTIGRFRAFVKAGMGTQQRPPVDQAGTHVRTPGSGWQASWNAKLPPNTAALMASIKCDPMLQNWTDSAGPNERRPISCITWYEAMAFCIWDGGYLPTEAEWNYASAGGNQQRAYPWSDPPSSTVLDASYASYGDGRDNCNGDGMPGCGAMDFIEVGTRPMGDGLSGQSDLAGNVHEWTLDWYDPTFPNPCSDCAALTAGERRVIRGGSYIVPAMYLRTGTRQSLIPSSRSGEVGVRCARFAP